VSVKLLEAVERGIPVVCPGALARDAGLGAGVIAADTVEDMIAAVRRFVREPAELPKRWETPATVGLQEFAAAVAPRTEAAA
jgi:hypothetical protein